MTLHTPTALSLTRLVFHAPWLGCTTWILIGLFPAGRSTLQPGPLAARGHQGLDCTACHAPGLGLLRQLPGGAHAMDQSCRACHQGHERHHARQLLDHAPRCLECHQEHRGREALTRVADAICTQCHGAFVRVDGRAAGCRPVSSWRTHPELDWDRGRVKSEPRLHFSHQRHLHPQGIAGPDRLPVQLACGVCHVPDAGGRHMTPVRYEASCAGCHPLRGVVLAGEPAAARAVSVRHAEPRLVLAEVRAVLAELVRRQPLPVRTAPGPAERRPWRGEAPALEEREWHWVERQVEVLGRQMFEQSGGCVLCHVAAPARSGLATHEPPRPGSPYFSHRAHRDVQCGQCHEVATKERLDALAAPKLALCASCHRDTAPQRRHEVRAECAACHGYHRPGRLTVAGAATRPE